MHKRRLIIIWGLSIWTSSQTYQKVHAGDGSFSGVSYSFTQDHPDFGVPACGLNYGNVTGLQGNSPVYGGEGHKVNRAWRRIIGAGAMPIAPNLYGTAVQSCAPVEELPGEAGDPDACSVESAATFARWFRPTLGVNQTWPVRLDDQDDIEGQWGIQDDNFKPAGVQGNLYTVALYADFVYEACGGHELDIAFRGDAWAFIGSTMVVDLGGTNHVNAWQAIRLDDLELNDGETYRLRIFLAHRTNGIPADLTIKTKGMTMVPVIPVTLGGGFD